MILCLCVCSSRTCGFMIMQSRFCFGKWGWVYPKYGLIWECRELLFLSPHLLTRCLDTYYFVLLAFWRGGARKSRYAGRGEERMMCWQLAVVAHSFFLAVDPEHIENRLICIFPFLTFVINSRGLTFFIFLQYLTFFNMLIWNFS